MKRRKFIEISSKGTVGMLFLGMNTHCATKTRNKSIIDFKLEDVSEGSLTPIREGLSRFNLKGGTIGVLDTNEGYFLVDAQFPDTIKFLLHAIKNTNKPVESLANTHHHGDHTAGNFSFDEEKTQIIAQSQVPEYQRLRAEEKGNLEQQKYASILFDDHLKIDIGNQSIHARHYDAGHTFGDAIFHFEKINVVHMGDLIFKNLLPVFRVADGSDANNWAKILDKIISEYDQDTIFIFGHADKPENTQGKKSDLIEMKQFMEAVENFGKQQFITNEKTVEEVALQYSYIPDYPNRLPIWDGHWNSFLENLKLNVTS